MNEDFFWLKIHEHFFDEDNILYLESLPNGEKYILFWQKLLLKCLKNKDKDDKNYSILRFSENIPYDPEILSKVTRTDIDTVKVAIDSFKKLGMIEILSDGSIYIESVHRLIGKRSESADRVKKFREKKKLLQVTNGNGECNANKEVTKEKKDIDEIENIYDSYPAKDPNNNNRSTGKSRTRDIAKISKLIESGEYTPEILHAAQKSYLASCAETKTYLANYKTFLNNIPDIPAEPASDGHTGYYKQWHRYDPETKKQFAQYLTEAERVELGVSL